MRFSEEEAVKTGDGIWTASLGIPSIGKIPGKLLMKLIINSSGEIKRWKKLIRESGGFIMFLTDSDSPESMIKLGRSFQRFGLMAASLNISHSHVNMPCEIPEIRDMISQDFHFETLYPVLLIRFGYGKTMPFSIRRNLNHILIKQKGNI